MKDIQAQMTDEELREYRLVEAKYKAMDSGSVSLSLDEAIAIVEEHRVFWTRMHEKYQLDIEEFHVFDAITGTISIDKAE